MKERIVNSYMCLMLSVVPLVLHMVSDILNSTQIEYVNYYSEFYFINFFIFAYDFWGLINKFYSMSRLRFITYFIHMNIIVMLSIIYISFFNQQYEIKGYYNIILITIFNMLFTVTMEIILIIRMNNDDAHCYENKKFSENRYNRYSENRYERYLLERIDEKLNSIKNPKSEKSEEDINEIISSEELMNGSDILAEMLKNHIEIKEYFRISKNQSKFSFYFSIVSSVVGIIVVIIAASGIVVLKNLGISIIAAVSGAITEIISGIVLWIHNKSALQLNYYYDSLHENEKFLSAVNIADKLSDEKKEDMYMEIIRKQIDIQPKDKENIPSDTDKK